MNSRDYEYLYKTLTKTFLQYAVRNLPNFSIHQLKEVMRVSLCDAMQLDTKDNCILDITPYRIDLRRLYIPVLNRYNVILKETDESKHKILEACVHCMEISCRKAGFKV